MNINAKSYPGVWNLHSWMCRYSDHRRGYGTRYRRRCRFFLDFYHRRQFVLFVRQKTGRRRIRGYYLFHLVHIVLKLWENSILKRSRVGIPEAGQHYAVSHKAVVHCLQPCIEIVRRLQLEWNLVPLCGHSRIRASSLGDPGGSSHPLIERNRDIEYISISRDRTNKTGAKGAKGATERTNCGPV